MGDDWIYALGRREELNNEAEYYYYRQRLFSMKKYNLLEVTSPLAAKE